MVRDRRRIDPLTGEARDPGATPGPDVTPETAEAGGTDQPEPEPDPADAKLAELSKQLDERTADLQRVTAEYANYRRRTDRDREAAAVATKAKIAADLLTTLDDIDRAAAHGDLTGAFKAVAEKLVGALNGLGLQAFGAEGDPFDPSVHEAVQHTSTAEAGVATVTVVTSVLRRGYQIGDRVLRPAMVVVTDQAERPADPEPSE